MFVGQMCLARLSCPLTRTKGLSQDTELWKWFLLRPPTNHTLFLSSLLKEQTSREINDVAYRSFFGTLTRMGKIFKGTQEAKVRGGEGTCRRLTSGGILNPRVWGLTPPPLSTCEDLSWSLSSYEICVIIPKCRWYPRNSPTSRVNMIFSTNGARTTGICMRKNKAGPLLHIININ